jgi:hypothetical protein
MINRLPEARSLDPLGDIGELEILGAGYCLKVRLKRDGE